MTKETWKNVREVATVTAVGAAEGALIAVPFSIAGGPIAGGVIGGATALTTELVGRSQKRTVTVRHTTEQAFTNESNGVTQTVSADVTSQQTVPAIKVADTTIREHLSNFAKATGDLQEWHFQTLVTKEPPVPGAIKEAKVKGFDFRPQRAAIK